MPLFHEFRPVQKTESRVMPDLKLSDNYGTVCGFYSRFFNGLKPSPCLVSHILYHRVYKKLKISFFLYNQPTYA